MRVSRQITRIPFSTSRAFSLAELLVVIAIIAILAMVLLAAFSIANGQAQSAVCQNHLRQIGIGLTMYVSDHGRYPPLTDTNSIPNAVLICFDKIYPYYPVPWTNSAWHCPTYVADGGSLERYWSSYCYNWVGSGRPKDRLGLGFRMDLGPTMAREPEVLAPSQMFAVADSRPTIWSNTPHGNVKMQLYSFGTSVESPPPHRKAYNVVFCDGHVLSVPRHYYLYPPLSASHWNRDNKPHPETWQTFAVTN